MVNKPTFKFNRFNAQMTTIYLFYSDLLHQVDHYTTIRL